MKGRRGGGNYTNDTKANCFRGELIPRMKGRRWGRKWKFASLTNCVSRSIFRHGQYRPEIDTSPELPPKIGVESDFTPTFDIFSLDGGFVGILLSTHGTSYGEKYSFRRFSSTLSINGNGD